MSRDAIGSCCLSIGKCLDCLLDFLHCWCCGVELVVQFPARGSTQVLLCLFPGVLWLWHLLYSVRPHPMSSLHIYAFVVSRAFMTGAASQAGDADSSRAPGLTSGLQGSVNASIVGATVTVHQFVCILLQDYKNLPRQGNPPECQRFAVNDEACRVVDVANLWHEGGINLSCTKSWLIIFLLPSQFS